MNARAVGVVLALVGLAVVAHPLYLFPHHGENLYHLSAVETVGEQSPAETVAYEDLPPVAQDRFEAELDGQSDGIWTGEHAAAYDAFRDHEYVAYRGEYYEYQFRGAGRLDGASAIFRMTLSTLAVVALVTGVFVARTRRFRPLTPLRALWLPVGVFTALAGTEFYDATVGGAFAPPSYVHLPAMAAVLVGASVVGSAVRDRRSFRPLLPVGLLVVAGTAFTVASGDPSAVGGGLFALVLVTSPWYVLGYALTGPPDAE